MAKLENPVEFDGAEVVVGSAWGVVSFHGGALVTLSHPRHGTLHFYLTPAAAQAMNGSIAEALRPGAVAAAAPKPPTAH